MAEWDIIHTQLQQSVKTRLSGLEKLHEYVQGTSVTREQISSLLDASGLLLTDSNHKVTKKTLEVWSTAVHQHDDLVSPYVNGLVPLAAERLADGKQEVRQAACDLLLDLARAYRPELVMERLRKCWGHKNWKVRHGVLQFMAEALVVVGEPVLSSREGPLAVLPYVIKLLEDPESNVRGAALETLEEAYKVLQDQLIDIINQHNLRPTLLREVYARLEQVAVQEGFAGHMPQPPSPLGRDVEEAASPYVQQSPQRSPGKPRQQQQARDVLGRPISKSSSYPDVLDHDLEHSTRHDQQHATHTKQQHPHHHHQQQQQQQQAVSSPANKPAAPRPGARRDTDTLDVGAPVVPAAALVQAAAFQPSKQRRGGFKDGGGVTADGVLPEAMALLLHSDRDLAKELEQIHAVLAGGTGDWDKRIAAMVRLEGLVKGGAAAFDQFGELLRPLVDQLVQQLGDRRSAVTRQAAHLVGQLAMTMGAEFEAHTATFLAVLFKVLVITVQIVSDSADSCVRVLLHHCPSPRALSLICDALTKDKNGKLRQHCAAYLLQVVEEWDVSMYQRQLAAVEGALQAAVTDAITEARIAGRAALAAYTAVLPERGVALVKRFDGPVQAKLREAISSYRRGAFTPATSPGTRPSSRAASTAASRRKTPAPPAYAPPAPASAAAAAGGGGGYHRSHPPSRSSSSTSLADSLAEAQGQQAHYAATASAAAGAASGGGGGAVRKGRKSMAGLPLRVTEGGGGAGGYTNSLSSIPDGHEAAGLPGDSRRRRASIMPQRVLQPDAFDVQQQQHQQPSSAAAPLTAASSGASGPYGSQRTGSSRGRPSLATTAFKVPAPPQHPEASAARMAAESSSHYGLSAGALRAQEQQQRMAAAAAAGGEPPPSRPPTASSEGHCPSERSYVTTTSHAGPYGRHHVHGSPASAAGPRCVGVARAVSAVLNNPRDWSSRVAAFDLLSDALQQQSESSSYADLSPDLDRVLPKLLVAVDDAHFKVSLAALGTVQAALAAAPRALEPHLDKLMPLLFLKLCGSKVQTRVAAEAALKACACAFTADVLLMALCRALDAMKQPAAKVSVMEFLVLYLGEGKAAGPATNPLHLRQWLARNLPLLLDKTGIVRQIAVRALHCIAAMDIDAVYAAAAAAPPPEGAAVQRALTDLMRARRHAQEEAEAAEAEVEGGGGAEGMAQVLLVDHSQAQATAGMHNMHPGSYAMAPDPQHMYHHQQQQQQQAASMQLAQSMADMQLSAAQQHQAPAAGYNHAGPAGLAIREEGRTLYPLLTQPSGAAVLSGQQQQQQVAPAGHAPVASSGWAPGDQSQPFQHLQAPAPTQAAAVAAAPAAPPSAAAGMGTFGPGSGDVTSSRSAAAGGDSGPFGGYMPAAAAPATPSAAPAAPAAAGPATSSAATPPGALVATSVLGRSFMASPALLTLNLEQLAASLPQEPAAQARHLTLLVHRLSSRPATGVLEELAACAQVLGPQAWQANFAKVLAAALPCTASGDGGVREMAYLLIRALATHQAPCFEPLLDVALQPLLQGCCDSSREVLMAAHQALERLMDAVAPRTSLDMLAYKLPSDASVASGTDVDGDMLAATIRCVQRAALRLLPSELMEVAPGLLLPGLVAAFSHPRPDVRKVVVFCLVELWLHVGASLTPYVESTLSSSQQKLLTIYYKRAVDTQAAGGAAGRMS